MADNPYERRGWADAALFVWLQAFGFGGAVGLSSVLQTVILWKDIFSVFVAWWDERIRPLADYLFSWAFNIFQLELSDFWKDWLAIGTIIGFGFLRQFALLAYKQARNKPIEDAIIDEVGPLIPPFLPWWAKTGPLVYAVVSPLLWPLTILMFIVDVIRAVWPPYDFGTKRFIFYSISSVILPFYWLALFVAVNEFLLS